LLSFEAYSQNTPEIAKKIKPVILEKEEAFPKLQLFRREGSKI
jgi:hypothetical protein